jgi:hypothetical protein
MITGAGFVQTYHGPAIVFLHQYSTHYGKMSTSTIVKSILILFSSSVISPDMRPLYHSALSWMVVTMVG